MLSSTSPCDSGIPPLPQNNYPVRNTQDTDAKSKAWDHDPKRKAWECDPKRKARECDPKRKAREHDQEDGVGAWPQEEGAGTVASGTHGMSVQWRGRLSLSQQTRPW